MPIKVSDKEFREIKGQLSLDGIMSKLLDYQKGQDTSIETVMKSINSSLESLRNFERKIENLSQKEFDVNRELSSLQQQIVNVLTIISNNFNLLKETKQKQDIALIQSLEKIANNLSQETLINSIDNLGEKLKPGEEWEVRVIRDTITGQMEGAKFKLIK